MDQSSNRVYLQLVVAKHVVRHFPEVTCIIILCLKHGNITRWKFCRMIILLITFTNELLSHTHTHTHTRTNKRTNKHVRCSVHSANHFVFAKRRRKERKRKGHNFFVDKLEAKNSRHTLTVVTKVPLLELSLMEALYSACINRGRLSLILFMLRVTLQ